jgi:hypothetical protein
MTRRMIDSGMWSNENFAALPAMARLLQIGMINHADDQGRVKANPMYLSKEVFPYDRVTPANISKWLELIATNGTVILYEVEGKQYAQLTKWWEYQSLQYAAPSDYPPPPNWRDRIRRTATKGTIVTHNWTLTNGVLVEDTCDEHGKPLPPKSKLNAKLPSTSTPPTNGNGHSPDNAPLDSPEPTPESTIELNRNELNLTEDQERENAPTRDPAPPPTVTIHARDGARNELHYQSPHIDRTHFDPATGYVSPGQGSTAVEVYYERFDICSREARLSPPKEDDLVRLCPDLHKLREVVTAYSRTSFRLGNLQLILDWYHKGVPDKSGTTALAPAARGNGYSLRGAERNMALMDQFEADYGELEITLQ